MEKAISIRCTGAAAIDIEELSPFQDDIKTMTPSTLKKLENVIISQGFSEPIAVWPNDGRNWILNGHQRHTALQSLRSKGWFIPPIPVAIVEADDEDEARKKVLTLASQFGDFNQDHLLEFVAKAKLDTDWIKNNARLAAGDFKWPVLVTPTDEDDVPEPSPVPIVQRGEIYLLGDHRLMCGDSTNADDVARLINGETIDMVFTSPPYNAGKNIRGNFYENDDDDKTENEFVEFLKSFTQNCLTHAQFVFVNIQILESNKFAVVEYLHAFKRQFKDLFIWNKSNFPPHINRGTFGTKFELVFCFSNESKSRGFPASWQGKYSNVIETESNTGNKFASIHGAGFPVSFPTWMIEKMDFAKNVFDPFMGTGTTLIAGENLQKKSFGMEMDPVYCGVILDRWEQLTGKSSCREDGETWASIKATRNG